MFETINSTIVTLAAVLGAIGVIWKAIINPVWGSYKKLTSIYNTLETHLPFIVNISNEFKPNGGSSIKDILTRIDKNTQGSISRLWTLLENSPYGYFETDVNGKCIKVNRRWLKLADLNSDQYKDYGWLNGIKSIDRDRVFREWEECIEQKREFSSIYTMSSGIRVKGEAYPIKADAGDILGWIGFVEPLELVI